MGILFCQFTANSAEKADISPNTALQALTEPSKHFRQSHVEKVSITGSALIPVTGETESFFVLFFGIENLVLLLSFSTV